MKFKLVYCETDNPDEEQKVVFLEVDDLKDLEDSIAIVYPEAKFFTAFDEDNNTILTEEGRIKEI